MTKSGDNRKLTSRQTLGWLVISALILSCLTAVIVRSARTQPMRDEPVKVTILPIPDDTAAMRQRAESAKKQKSKSKKKSSTPKAHPKKNQQKNNKQKNPQKPPANNSLQREITKEDL
ncbi:MAG: hypothetical protein NC402_02845 [Prevotella sp.]|nr:hypothetical protein [Prevotella sp.]MCM1074796.1 hypothetical protein [Ruminococcus sp.]